ncbi:FAD-dependent oxidoreductase, partial [bacterium]|nr:FAD-dependent oxidoreductase [bacterium]
SASARRQLERLGVEVRTGPRVTAIDSRGVTLGAETIPARTVLWAAGVAASPLGRSLGAPVDKAGRVQVERDLSVPGHREVFVIGDLAAAKEEDGKPVPGVAPAAIQEGIHAARNVRALLRGERTEPFHYRDKGSLATIGRSAGVAALGSLQLSGCTAWLAWLLVHIFFLIGFRNRVLVILEWAWAYATYERGARLITGPTGPLLESGDSRVDSRSDSP